MVIVYATTRYVSRYFPAFNSVLTFPVVYQYTASPGYRDSSKGCIDNYNMTNDSTTSGVIIQRRPSVIKRAPKHEQAAQAERECEMVDVVGLDEGVKDEFGEKMDGLKTGEEETTTTKRKMESSIENGSRRSKRRRGEVTEKNGCKDEHDTWKPPENKRHVCEECGMRFKKPSALVIHLRTHSGERPFSCELCDKRFSISGNLRRHMFTHTGEKPYKCRACGRAFNNPSHLARHSKKIHI